MSANQQWSSGMNTESRQQQVFQGSGQAPINFTHALNGSSQEQRMNQPRTVNHSFNSNSVNLAPFYPNLNFRPYQTQLTSSLGTQPFQYNSQSVTPGSSRSADKGNNLAFGYTPVTAVQAQAAHVNGRNGVYFYPNACQLTSVDSGELQRNQMLLQRGRTGHNQTIPTQTSQFCPGHLTSQRAGTAQSAQGGVWEALYGEAPSNRPLSAPSYQAPQNISSLNEPTDSAKSLKQQNRALMWQLTLQKAEIERLHNDCHRKDEIATNLKKQSDQKMEELKKLKNRTTKYISRGQSNFTTNAEDVTSHEVKICRLRAIIKGQREEIERLNILFRLHNICVEDKPTFKKGRTNKEAWRIGDEILERASSNSSCSNDLDSDDATWRNESYESAESIS